MNNKLALSRLLGLAEVFPRLGWTIAVKKVWTYNRHGYISLYIVKEMCLLNHASSHTLATPEGP